tara:strand:- start:2408 stop:3565 length:1158 start_codon:yes stop_codon:yes gene_type:complete
MKKILVIHTKYRITGGEDIAVESEVSALKNNFLVETLYFTNKDIDNFFLQIIYFLINRNTKTNKILIEKLNSFKPDLVYIHNTWFKASLGVFKILNKFDIKYIIKLHNYRFECGRYITIFSHLKNENICKACGLTKKNNIFFNKYFQDSYLKSIFLIVYSKRYFKILKKSKVLTLTLFQKKYLIKKGFDAKNIETLVNPIDNIDLKTSEHSFRLEPKSYLIYAGLLSEEKGIKKLIETYKLLVNYEKKLVIVGEGPLLKELKDSNKNQNILFLGKLDNSDVISLIKNSYSVVTNTSLYEGQPTLLSEASKLGINSVYPVSGGIGEFFPENNPFAFKVNSEIELLKKLKLLKHKEIVQTQAKKNYKHIESMLSTKNYIDKFKESVS